MIRVLPGRRIALFGRFQSIARTDLTVAINSQRGQVVRDINDRTDAMIIGHGAIIYADTDHLNEKLKRCRQLRIAILSEREAIEALELADPSGAGVPVEIIASKSKLSDDEIEFLRVFDVVTVRNGQAQFGDMEKAQTVNALLEQGKTLAEIVKAFHQLGDEHRLKVTTAPNGDLAVKWGNAHATFSGQGLLPLSAAPPLEELFEAALEAETTGDLVTARRLFEACAQSDKKDAVAAFNLGNVLVALHDKKTAALQFHRALARDPALAEAHYNLGLLSEAEGEIDAAAKHFADAINSSSDYTDALYNYGLLEFRRNNFDVAAPLFRRFVELEPAGDWAERAQKALHICKRA